MILFLIFEFVMNVMMLNIMIASMTNSFSKVTQVRRADGFVDGWVGGWLGG